MRPIGASPIANGNATIAFPTSGPRPEGVRCYWRGSETVMNALLSRQHRSGVCTFQRRSNITAASESYSSVCTLPRHLNITAASQAGQLSLECKAAGIFAVPDLRLTASWPSKLVSEAAFTEGLLPTLSFHRGNCPVMLHTRSSSSKRISTLASI